MCHMTLPSECAHKCSEASIIKIRKKRYGASQIRQCNSAVSSWIGHCQRGLKIIAGGTFENQRASAANFQDARDGASSFW